MKAIWSVTAAMTLMGGAGLSAAVSESDYYEIVSFPQSDDQKLRLEICSMATLRDGNLMIGTRRGDVYVVEDVYGDPAEATFRKWAGGMNHPLGLLEHDGWIYLAQRGELTRLKDSTGDGKADIFETVCDEWQISGNYHEYNFGPRLDKEGYLWVTLNKPFGREPYGRADWRGWAVRVDPKSGKMYPMCAGLRSPAGVEVSPAGDVFYSDNQGEWCNASKISHLEFGDFHGHPHGLPSQKLAGPPFDKIPKPESGTWMKDLHETVPQFKMPAVWLPYEKMGKSPSGMKWDVSEGKFGPFAGQMFVGDQHHAWIMRVAMEKIDGHWQGACFRFRRGFQCGIIRIAFGRDHSLFVGMSNAGWSGLGNKPWGLQRLVWNGRTPFEIHTMKAKPDGFELAFTEPVDVATASNAATYKMESYTYQLRSGYGGPEDDKKEVKVVSSTVSDDGLRVRLKVEPLRAGYVHELHVSDLMSRAGVSLLHPEAYYTLVKIPES